MGDFDQDDGNWDREAELDRSHEREHDNTVRMARAAAARFTYRRPTHLAVARALRNYRRGGR